MKSASLFVMGLLIFGGGAGVLLAQIASKDFPPPRTAVVDTFEVIEQYKKKQELEAKLRAEVELAVKEVDGMESELKRVEAELKIVEEGTEDHKNLILKKAELQFRLKSLQEQVNKDMSQKQLSAIQEIRKEVELEIERVAKARELDLVLEKKIPLEGRGKISINIPIVRFATPEIEITREVARILNERYRRVSSGK